MSCSNPNCISYVPNCTNYTYACPSCTDCCTDIINTNCVKYKGAALSCIPVATNDTLTTIITAINTKFCSTTDTEYDIQCLGGASNADEETTIQALIDSMCTENTNLFDTTCLGGSADRTIYQAMSNVITKICNSDYTYPVIDTSCMDGGLVSDDLTGAVEKLVVASCTGQTCTLDWELLTAPETLVDTPLCEILDSVVDNLRCSIYNFSNEFVVTTAATCVKSVELDVTVVAQEILDEVEGTPAMVTQLRDMGLAKMFAAETCEKGSIEEKLIFSDKFDVRQLDVSTFDFEITFGDGGGTNKFLGIVLPSGIYHESPIYNRSAPVSIQSWLNALGLGTFTVTNAAGFATVTVTMTGSADYYPVVLWTSTPGSDTLYSTLVNASESDPATCEMLLIDIDAPSEWTPVEYDNLWNNTVPVGNGPKYRYNKINNTIEIRPGYISKSIDPSFASSFTELAFYIPVYMSDGKAVWNPHGIIQTTCVEEDTECVKQDLNVRLRVENTTNNFYVDIDDCLRTEAACAGGDVVTISIPPMFYYVL